MKNEIKKLDEPTSQEMGQQLTTQYERAIGGIREVAVFGGMMLQIREVVSTCGHNSKRGPQTKGDGLKAWLEQYAPQVSRPTAYRFMELAEGLRTEFKLGVKVDMTKLLGEQPKKLDPKLAKKRDAILKFIEGKSQRQILMQIGNPTPKSKGGHNPRKGPPLTAEEKIKQEHDDTWESWTFHEREILTNTFGDSARNPNWDCLTTPELAQLQKSFSSVATFFAETIKLRKGKHS